MFKKILACVLVTITVLALFSGCANEETPDGMYSATIEGEPYIFYVPEGWTDNRDSGMSSAYYSLDIPVLASARYYTTDGTTSLETYVKDAIASYKEQYATSLSKDIMPPVATKLGKMDGLKCEYVIKREQEKIDGTKEIIDLLTVQYFVLYKNDVIVMSILCNEKNYDEYKPDFDAIVQCFAFRDKTAVADGVVNEDTPAGMKRISFDGCEYLFYAPTSWKCNMTDKLTEAYFSDSDKSNITVTSFAPDDPMTAEEYVERCKITYAKELAGYSYISVSDARIDDRGENDYIPAKKYLYSVASSGKQYKIMQTVFVYNNMVYSITYTSAVENFDSHISDVNSMLLAFRFR